jgi:hypothetical protein
MTQGKQISRTEYVTPKSDEEIIAKAILELEHPLTPLQKQQQETIDKLIAKLMIDNNMKKACSELGISRTTGYKYWGIWEKEEEAQYVNSEWWSLYHEVKKTNKAAALKMLTALKLRFHPEKINFKGEITETKKVIHLHMWRPGDEPADTASKL